MAFDGVADTKSFVKLSDVVVLTTVSFNIFR